MAEYDGKVFTGDKMKPVLDNLATEYTKKVSWGLCTSDTATKTVTVGSKKTFSLEAGAVIAITFAGGVQANSTLNVNSTGAKNIIFRGSNITAGIVSSGDTVFLEYTGQAWKVIDSNTWREVKVGGVQKISPVSNSALDFVGDGGTTVTYESNAVKISSSPGNGRIVGYGVSTEAMTVAAKTASISGYSLVSGNVVAVRFSYPISSGATLNVSSTGAKPIYYNGAQIEYGVVYGGDTILLRYNGTQYEVISNLYTLPAASSQTLGGIKPGLGLSMDSTDTDVLNLNPIALGPSYTFDTTDHLVLFTNSDGHNLVLPVARNGGYANSTGLVSVPVSRSYAQDTDITEYNAISVDDNGAIFLPVAHGNAIGAVAPGDGLSMGEGGHIELNQADNSNIGGMLLYNTTTETVMTKEDGTLTADAIRRYVISQKADTAQFQGSVGTGTSDVLTPDTGNTPFSSLTDYKKGWYWVVATAGTYCGSSGTGGYSCEAGDFIFCIEDKGNGNYNPTHFTVVQNNIEIITTSEVTALWNDVFN